MSNINSQIEAYIIARDFKAHEVELLEIIHKDFPDFTGRLLDIGCANGSFIDLMSRAYKNAEYTAFDIAEDLIDLANKKEADSKVKCNAYQSSKVRPCTTPHSNAISSFSLKSA